MSSNPYTIIFGKEPAQIIERPVQMEQLLSDFTSENPSSQAYIITGVRGTGKTVSMTQIAEKLSRKNNWIVLDVNPEEKIEEQVAGKLASIPSLSVLFTKAEINLSLFGLGVSIKTAPPIANINAAIERMLQVINKEGKRLLITIDEVTNNEYLRIFAHSFQSYLRAKLPVFLLMTGLYENISSLQDEKSLTFLYRTPKIFLKPLNLAAITANYASTFSIDYNKAKKMADLTGGYAFAFQVLGYLCWQQKPSQLINVLPMYDQYLQEYVYEKIWSELSEKDKSILRVIADGVCENKQIRDKLGMTSGLMSVYRRRLMDKGLIDTSTRGRMRLMLPRFAEYVRMMADEC